MTGKNALIFGLFFSVLFGCAYIVLKMDKIEPILKVKSNNSVVLTADKIEEILTEKGMKIFARIDHSANASKVELNLRPTQLILFGNPKMGTPLMLSSQTMAIDLPQKALVYEDESGEVFINWNNPFYLKDKHGISDKDELLEKIDGALRGIMTTAAK